MTAAAASRNQTEIRISFRTPERLVRVLAPVNCCAARPAAAGKNAYDAATSQGSILPARPAPCRSAAVTAAPASQPLKVNARPGMSGSSSGVSTAPASTAPAPRASSGQPPAHASPTRIPRLLTPA